MNVAFKRSNYMRLFVFFSLAVASESLGVTEVTVYVHSQKLKEWRVRSSTLEEAH